MSRKHRPVRVPLTSDEKAKNFRRAWGNLRLFAGLYDGGDVERAIDLALPICHLAHDGGQRSLINQLGIGDRLRYLNSVPPLNDASLLTEHPMVRVQFNPPGMPKYMPKLLPAPRGRAPLFTKFGKWWKTPILRDNKRRTLTRADVALGYRNQLGGAHADEAVEEVLAGAARGVTIGWTFERGGRKYPLEGGILLASLRQIAWELDQSLSIYAPPELRP